MTQQTLTFGDLQLTMADIYAQMAVSEGTEGEAFAEEIGRILEEIRPWLKPRLSFSVMRGTLDAEKHLLTLCNGLANETTFNIGNIISHQLKGSEAYSLFICSAGTEYQEYQDRLMAEGDMVRVFIADAIGSQLAEKCADRMEEFLQKSIDKLHWNRTNRFSPGYCGWHVSQQQKLFPLMQNHGTGVRLTESSLMIPIKSVSGVIGLGPEVKYNPYTCGLCNFAKCYKRRKRSKEV